MAQLPQGAVVNQDRRTNMLISSVNAPMKKGGAGGNYTWGAPMDVKDFLPVGYQGAGVVTAPYMSPVGAVSAASPTFQLGDQTAFPAIGAGTVWQTKSWGPGSVGRTVPLAAGSPIAAGSPVVSTIISQPAAAPAAIFCGGPGSLGPAWTRDEIEAPAGEKDMGTWTATAYTEEQQERLGVDEQGNAVVVDTVVTEVPEPVLVEDAVVISEPAVVAEPAVVVAEPAVVISEPAVATYQSAPKAATVLSVGLPQQVVQPASAYVLPQQQVVQPASAYRLPQQMGFGSQVIQAGVQPASSYRLPQAVAAPTYSSQPIAAATYSSQPIRYGSQGLQPQTTTIRQPTQVAGYGIAPQILSQTLRR